MAVVIVIFPYEPQLQLRDDKPNRDYILKPQRKLAALCAQYQVLCLDLYQSFAAEYDRGERFYRDGIHLNEYGHRFTTGKISEFLRTGPAVGGRHQVGASIASPVGGRRPRVLCARAANAVATPASVTPPGSSPALMNRHVRAGGKVCPVFSSLRTVGVLDVLGGVKSR